VATFRDLCEAEFGYLGDLGFSALPGDPDQVTFRGESMFVRLSWDVRDRDIYVTLGRLVSGQEPFPPREETHVPLPILLRKAGVTEELPVMQVDDLEASVRAVAMALRREASTLLSGPFPGAEGRRREALELALGFETRSDRALVTFSIVSRWGSAGYPSLGTHSYGVRPETVAVPVDGVAVTGAAPGDQAWVDRATAAAVGSTISGITAQRVSIEGGRPFVVLEVALADADDGGTSIETRRRMESVVDRLRSLATETDSVACVLASSPAWRRVVDRTD
jgi:hypothetical protein